MSPTSTVSRSLYEVNEAASKITMHLHAGQLKAWHAQQRIVAVVSGTQSGKTSFVPLWLYNEINNRGPGDYALICPTFTLMELKALPAFKQFFQTEMRLGTYVGSPVRKFTFHEQPTTIYFGYAENPDSLESATYKAVVCDEAGQKAFKRGSWEALQRRVAIHQGRILITTTPYSNAGWLRTEIYDRWTKGDQDIAFVRFRSIDNPAFPPEEYERARRTLPPWKFRMFYEGSFEQPAGKIYDCWDDAYNRCPRFAVNPKWQRYLGLDFGGVNTAGVFLAQDPGSQKLYAYREYHAGQRTAREHVAELLKDEPMLPICVGGSHSEDQWRIEFRQAGLPVQEPPIKDVEVGIDRVYGAIKTRSLVVFDDLLGLLDEIGSYARELDDRGEPTEKIEAKEQYHRLDAVRYLCSWLFRGATEWKPKFDGPDQASEMSKAPKGVFQFD